MVGVPFELDGSPVDHLGQRPAARAAAVAGRRIPARDARSHLRRLRQIRNDLLHWPAAPGKRPGRQGQAHQLQKGPPVHHRNAVEQDADVRSARRRGGPCRAFQLFQT